MRPLIRLTPTWRQETSQRGQSLSDHYLVKTEIKSGELVYKDEDDVAPIDLTLEQAADTLKLAEGEMKAGRREEAKVALHTASDELKQYEKSAGENRAKEVKQLHQEIDRLTTDLTKGKPTAKVAAEHATKISGLWQRVTKWFKNL